MLLVDDVNFRFTSSAQAPLNHRRNRTMTTQHNELELQESIERDVEAMKTFPYAWLQNFAEGKADSKGRQVTGKDVELIARSLGNRINILLREVEDLRSRTGKGEEWKAPKLVFVPAIDRIGITKEAARGIWQSQLKHCAQSAGDGSTHKERLIDLLRDLSMLTGQDMTLPLGQFLSGDGEDHSSDIGGVDQNARIANFLVSLLGNSRGVKGEAEVGHVLCSLINQLTLLLLVKSLTEGQGNRSALKPGDDDLRSSL